MKAQLMLAQENDILYKTIEVPSINVGWEIYVKFDNHPPKYVKVTRVTLYDHESPVDKAMSMVRGKEQPDVVCMCKWVDM
jgi:hypothetical protein